MRTRGVEGSIEADEEREGVDVAVLLVGDRHVAQREVQKPKGHAVAYHHQVGDGQVADVEVVQRAEGGLGQQRGYDEDVAKHTSDAGQPAQDGHQHTHASTQGQAGEGGQCRCCPFRR